jgi:exopolysaccharide production protein ExoQ
MQRLKTAQRPLGAIVSQVLVAGASLVLQLIALRSLGAAGLGSFSLLLGILVTVNSVQTGWIGDSLTVLDRFEPGMRRAIFQSQAAAVVIVAIVTTSLALPIGGVDLTTALLFGVASVMWTLEETLRRLLIARREFWKLVVNDASFAAGSFGLLAVVVIGGSEITLQTLVASLLAGAVSAIAVGLLQLPSVELSVGLPATARMRELTSFAIWRAVQVAMRPGSQAAVRAVVAVAVSLEALGRLEAARLLIAPVLTVVNGAGVYLLPTYAAQAKRRAAFRPGVARAMIVVSGLAAAYGLAAIALRTTLAGLLTDGATIVTTGALAAWVVYSVGFGAGVPAGSAMVALGRSRRAFAIRGVDAVIGVLVASLLAIVGWVSAVPAGLGLGAVVGALLLHRALASSPRQMLAPTVAAAERPAPAADAALYEAQVVPPPPPRPATWRWNPVAASPAATPVATPVPPSPTERHHPDTRATGSAERSHSAAQGNLLWLVPLALIVATEYKIRRRSIDDVLSGSIDPMIAAELAVYAAVGVWVVWRLVPTRPRLRPLLVLMWGYTLTTAVSAIYSEFPMLALARAVQLVIIAAVVHLLAVEGGFSSMKRFLHGWIVLLSASIVAGLAYVAPTTGPQEGRFTWLSVHSVSAGSMLALSVPVLFGLWLSAGRRDLTWPRWTYGSLLAVHLVFLLLTRTRGSIGGALAGIAVMAWLSSGRRMKPELALGSLVVGGAMALAFGRQVLDFLTRGESVDQIGTFNRRTEIWALAWDSFQRRPIFGSGFASAKGVFFDETGLGGAHNAAINVVIDVGLAGLLWWVALIVAALLTLSRLRRSERRSMVLLPGATGSARSDQLILLGVFVAGLVNSITTEGLGAGVNVSAIWLFISVAWLTILDRERSGHRSPVEGAGELRREVRDRQLEPLT